MKPTTTQRIPALWAAASNTTRPPLRRLPALCAVRLADFVRRLAAANHRPFGML